MSYNIKEGVILPFTKKYMKLLILAVAGIFVFMQALFLLPIAEAATASVSNEAELVSALADSGNDTINIDSDFSVSSRIDISREVLINGNNHTLTPTFARTDNSNNATLGVLNDNVTISNLIVDGVNGTNLHGVNIYTSTGIVLDNVTSTDNDRSGIVVNGSSVTVNNITTSGNGWHGINVDLGGGVTDPAVLTVNGVSIHTDALHIYSDHYHSDDVTINDTNSQYEIFDAISNDDDRLYQLDPERFVFEQGNNEKVNICHANNGIKGFTSNKVDLDGLSGHGDHEDDIIPPNPDLPDGLNWTRDNIEIWQNDCDDGEVLGEQCEVGPGWADSVVSENQALRKNGTAVLDARSNPDSALGAPDGVFFSLGFGGSIELEFNGYIVDETGDDIEFTEITGGTYPQEDADVEVSQDGIGWQPAGTTNNIGDNGVDISSTTFDWIKFVRITDASNPDPFEQVADGFDLDAVGADLVCEPPEQIEPCEIGTTIFQIGDVEASQTDHPADEFTGSGNPGDFGTAHADPFVIGTNTDDEFPWNSNFSQGYGLDFEVDFNYTGPEVAEAKLIVSWSPGKSATENKTVSLDDSVIDSYSRNGTPVSGWYNNSKVYQEETTFALTQGDHTLRFEHTSGDGTFWDYVRLEVSDCPEQEIEPCTVGVFSDTTNQVVETGSNAQDLDFEHPSWVDENDLSPAIWIWGDNPVQNPDSEETQTFTKTFYWNGPADSAELKISADNGYEVVLNGTVVASDADPYNWQTIDTHSGLDGEIVQGLNTLEIKVTNYAGSSNPANNPAGLLYNLTVVGSDQDCDEEPEEEPVTVNVQKVLCLREELLPNWGDGEGESHVSESTAQDFVDESEGECELVDWDFEIYLGNTSNPGDNLEQAGGDWQTFQDSFEFNASEVDGSKVWLREVTQEGFIPFSGDTSNPFDEFSAEFYCHNDILNYDNYDYIDNIEEGATYNCIGFNAYQPVGQIQGLVYNDTNEDGVQDLGEDGIEGWDIWLLTQNSPYKIYAIANTSTLGGGQFSFNDLPFGTYFVCQDIPEGWVQTQLNDAGTGGVDPLSTPGIGDVLDLDDAEVALFCYEVQLGPDNAEVLARDFGNFQAVLGAIDDNKTQTGSVLGTTTGGQVLAETGQFILGVLTLAGATIGTAAWAGLSTRKKEL